MIEVEKKVILREVNLQEIERLGTFLDTKMLTDTYFDTADFRYTTSDIWLRERGCRFELKLGIKGPRGTIDRYEEITDEELILKKLELKKEKSFLLTLEKASLFPFATLQTIRRKYQIEEYTIDLDLAYFDDFIYRIAEIEMMVSSEDQIPDAERSIEAFAKKMGVDAERPIKAKLIEYLSQKNPSHYEALIRSGIISGTLSS